VNEHGGDPRQQRLADVTHAISDGRVETIRAPGARAAAALARDVQPPGDRALWDNESSGWRTTTSVSRRHSPALGNRRHTFNE